MGWGYVVSYVSWFSPFLVTKPSLLSFGTLYLGLVLFLLFTPLFNDLCVLYAPGPTALGVEINSFNGAAPLISLLYPNVYLILLFLCRGCPGLYCGPGVALYFRGSFTNRDSNPIRTYKGRCLLYLSASLTSN